MGFYAATGDTFIDVCLMANNEIKGLTTMRVIKDYQNTDSATVHSIVELNVGDQVYDKAPIRISATFYENQNRYNRFSVFLLR